MLLLLSYAMLMLDADAISMPLMLMFFAFAMLPLDCRHYFLSFFATLHALIIDATRLHSALMAYASFHSHDFPH